MSFASISVRSSDDAPLSQLFDVSDLNVDQRGMPKAGAIRSETQYQLSFSSACLTNIRIRRDPEDLRVRIRANRTNFLPESQAILVSGTDGRGAHFASEVWNLVWEEERQHLIESIPSRMSAVVDSNGKRIDY
jgi:hypothetical protein